MSKPALAAWQLPLIVAAIAVSIVGGFYLGGPGLGMAVGALAATAILVMAIRNPPLHPIRPPQARDRRRHVLVVLAQPLEGGQAIESLLAIAAPAEGERGDAEILLLAPSAHRFLDRWTSDCGPGRERAQRNLVLSAANLAKAGVSASARVGDEDLTQSTEDALRSFPATEVLLVTGTRGKSRKREAAFGDLLSRVEVPCRRLCLDGSERESNQRNEATRRQASSRAPRESTRLRTTLPAKTGTGSPYRFAASARRRRSPSSIDWS
ncbi:MAG TPA: hypothetical protein VGV34_02435 [Solirubrobacterales bacterium]|nr:hypothetical protein [Solirubrobacterales bacterium]